MFRVWRYRTVGKTFLNISYIHKFPRALSCPLSSFSWLTYWKAHSWPRWPKSPAWHSCSPKPARQDPQKNQSDHLNQHHHFPWQPSKTSSLGSNSREVSYHSRCTWDSSLSSQRRMKRLFECSHRLLKGPFRHVAFGWWRLANLGFGKSDSLVFLFGLGLVRWVRFNLIQLN